MNKKKRILVLCPDIPYPIIAGGHMRMASIIPALSAVATVHVYYFDHGKPISDETAQWFKRLGITYSSYHRKHRSTYEAIVNKLTMIVHCDNLCWYHDEQQDIDAQIKTFQPDCLWLETPYLIRYVVRMRMQISIIIDYWGLLSEGSYREFLHAPLSKKAAKLVYWFIATVTEKRYANLLPNVVSVSTPVSSYLKYVAPKCTTFTIPNGIVKVHSKTASRYDSINECYDFILTGDFGFIPNIDAALYFVSSILALIRNFIPKATLLLCGRNPSEKILSLKNDPLITVSGFVDDLLHEIARSKVYILPLRMGSGIRSKLFDVFPLGKPIVTTSTGAEGLELKDNENCFIADSPEIFAQRCIELLNDITLRRTIGQQVKKLATITYAQKTIETKVAHVITTVVKG